MKHFFSRKISQIATAVSLALIPAVVFATTNNLCDLAQIAASYFGIAVKIIIGLAVVVFVFNVYRYFFTNKENKERGMYLLWSIIGFAVILYLWGLVNLISNTFNLNNSAPTMFGSTLGSNSSSPCTTSSSITQPNINNGGSITQPNTSGLGSPITAPSMTL